MLPIDAANAEPKALLRHYGWLLMAGDRASTLVSELLISDCLQSNDIETIVHALPFPHVTSGRNGGIPTGRFRIPKNKNREAAYFITINIRMVVVGASDKCAVRGLLLCADDLFALRCGRSFQSAAIRRARLIAGQFGP